MFDISGQVVVITGACGLIGKILSEAFTKADANLVLVDLQASRPNDMAKKLGRNAIGFGCDVSDSKQVNYLVKLCINTFSKVDVLINCHQYKPEGFLESSAESFPEELWDSIIKVNLKGTFLTCRDFGQLMIKNNGGSIINFASVYGVVSSNPSLYEGNSLGNPVAYSASKGGVIMLSKYLASYWAKYNVRVNCITPHGVFNQHENSFIENFVKKSPLGRMMMPEEIIGGVFFLASEASSYVTGTNLIVDGGWTAW